MTRTPAPADHSDLDLALREAAEQWRADFEVPPMPLLGSSSQPIEAPAPARLRWTRPVLVAASIIALGALTAAVISVAQPGDRVAEPAISVSPVTSSSPISSSGESGDEHAWPAPVGGDLVIGEGTPPPSVVIDGTVMILDSTEAPNNLVIDSHHPNFVGVTGMDYRSPCGSVTRIYLDRIAADSITVTAALYRADFTKAITCDLRTHRPVPLLGSAPYPLKGNTLIVSGTHVTLPHIDLADYRPPPPATSHRDTGSMRNSRCAPPSMAAG